MERNIHEQQNPLKKSKTNGSEIPLPTNERLEKMIFALPISFPTVMLPVRIPELYHKMKNRQYPDYFYFSVLTLGNRICVVNITDVSQCTWHKTPTTDEDINLESLYTEKSIELLKKEVDIRNPLYLWTCVILLAHNSRNVDNIVYEILKGLSSVAVRISKIYQLDLSKIAKMKYAEEELEFRRRVFWSFYSFDRLAMFYYGSFPTIQDRDIVVNLPKNDFFWRYGGECKEKHPDLMLWNNLANDIDDDQHQKESHKDLIKAMLLHGKITLFARRRWITKDYNPDDDNSQLIKLIVNIDSYSNNIVIPNSASFEKIKQVHEKYENTLRMTIEIESQILNYIFDQMHNTMKIVLYQTEMVRVKGRYMHPGRVVSAKNIISECAEKQIDLLHNFNQVLPPNHSENIASPCTLVSGVVCLNLMGINPSGRKFDAPLKLKILTDEYKKMGLQADLFLVYPLFLNRLSDLIGKARPENKKYRMIFENMKKFSIDESDVHPWLVSKYASYFFIKCCFERSFSILEINEYLNVDESTISAYSIISNAGTEGNINIHSYENYQHLFTDDENAAFSIPTSTNTNSIESYKINYELYTKYSQLLKKYPPNSIESYFFQNMADIYSSKIVNDILTNPANNQNGFEVSFNIPSTSYNISNLINRVEDEDDQDD
ncbi:hypothetical protein BB559_006627 [Furculomyces boomerangus]|uniref:Xylanolytic transcriptional activator regulatory domain-containing protein n=1 Tax=Furculomyces boomerangus TaxID=61424 RepID=A0A2T9Y1F1_9FUNG|nr:hypothetical protein BB559_006627 [Furculomyces boomerangus]